MAQQDRARQMGDIDTIMAQQEAQREVQRQSEAASQFDPKYFNMRPGHASKVRIGQEMPRGFAARLAGGPQSDDYGMNYPVAGSMPVVNEDAGMPPIPGGGPTPSQAEDAIGPPGIGGNNFYGMVTDPTPDVAPILESMVASQAGAGADYEPEEWDGTTFAANNFDKTNLDAIKNETDAEAAVDKALTEKDDPASKKAAAASKKLSKADKKANLKAMKDVWKDWVDYKDVLWENVEKAREKHGFWSEKAREASDDYQLWMGSDFYSKALARTDPGKAQQMLAKIPYLGSLGSTGLKGLQYVEDIFHGFGKTERRSAEKVLNDMKTDPGKYETKGEGGAYYLREMYPFLSNAPDDVVTNALNSGPYLRYLLGLQMGGQRMPTMYDPNWGGDNSWLYAD